MPQASGNQVDADVYRELQFIAERQPALETYAPGERRERIADLVLKGVLELTGPVCAGQARHSNHGPVIPGVLQKAGPFTKARTANAPPGGIREIETKTTPTCLSSYLI